MFSAFSPIKFNKKPFGNYEDNSFYSNSYNLDTPPTFKQEFVDKAETTYYIEEISGSFGFTDISEFITTGAVNPVIDDCSLCVDSGRVIYTNLDGAVTGKVVSAKVDGVMTIEVRENATVIDSFVVIDGYFQYTLDQDYTNLNLTFQTDEPYCIDAVMLCEPLLDYTLCGEAKTANLMDVSPYGGVYLVTSSDASSIENVGSTWTQTIFRYKFDTSTITNYGIGKIQIYFVNGYVLEYNNSVDFITDLKDAYAWISSSDDGTTVTLDTPYLISSIDFNNTVNNDFSTATQTFFGSIVTEEYYFIADGTENYEGNLTLVNETQTGSLIVNVNDVDFTKTILVDYAVVTADEVYKYIDCCVFELDDYLSEPVSIVQSSSKCKITYFDSCYRLDLVADFEYCLWIDLDIKRIQGEESNNFEGEERNYQLNGLVKFDRQLNTKELIPDYLCEILEGVFLCESTQINGINYSKSDSPSFDYVSPLELLCDFEIKIRFYK